MKSTDHPFSFGQQLDADTEETQKIVEQLKTLAARNVEVNQQFGLQMDQADYIQTRLEAFIDHWASNRSELERLQFELKFSQDIGDRIGEAVTRFKAQPPALFKPPAASKLIVPGRQ